MLGSLAVYSDLLWAPLCPVGFSSCTSDLWLHPPAAGVPSVMGFWESPFPSWLSNILDLATDRLHAT
jgi:hypothetical protein